MTQVKRIFAVAVMVSMVFGFASVAMAANRSFSSLEELLAVSGISKIEPNGATGTVPAGDTWTFNFTGTLDSPLGSGVALPQSLAGENPFTAWYVQKVNLVLNSLEELVASEYVTVAEEGNAYVFDGGSLQGDVVINIEGKADYYDGNAKTTTEVTTPAKFNLPGAMTFRPKAKAEEPKQIVVENAMTSADITNVAHDITYQWATDGRFNGITATIDANVSIQLGAYWKLANVGSEIVVPGGWIVGPTTFTAWVDQDWVKQNNGLEITTANIDNYGEREQLEGKKWTTIVFNENLGESVINTASGDISWLVYVDGYYMTPRTIDAFTKGTIYCAPTADVNGSKAESFANADSIIEMLLDNEKPKTLKDDAVNTDPRKEYISLKGKVGAATFNENRASNVVKVSADPNENTITDNVVVVSKTGDPINEVTIYVVVAKSDGGNGSNSDSGSGGGGGCDMGIGGFALLVTLPLVLKGKRS